MPRPEPETRPFWVKAGSELVHRTNAEDERCQPKPNDNVGFLDRLESAEVQGFIPCPICKPGAE